MIVFGILMLCAGIIFDFTGTNIDGEVQNYNFIVIIGGIIFITMPIALSIGLRRAQIS